MNNKFKKIPITTIPIDEGRLFTEKPRIKEYYNFEKNADIDYTKLIPGSSQYIWLKCPVCGYEWRSQVKNFSGCGFCAKNTVRTGYNDALTMFPELELDFVQEKNPGIDLSKESSYSTKNVDWVCHTCGYEWNSTILNRISRRGGIRHVKQCKKCYLINKRRERSPELFNYLDMQNNRLIDLASNDKLKWLCPKHGQFIGTWKEVSEYYQRYRYLPCCHDENQKKKIKKYLSDFPELVAEFSPKNKKKPEELSEKSSYPAIWFCEEHGEYKMEVRYRTVKGRGCPKCRTQNNYFYIHRDEIEKMYSDKNEKPFSEIRAYSEDDMILVCENGHEFIKKPSSIADYNCITCPTCQKLSMYQDFKASVLNSHENIINLWDDEKNYEYFIIQNNQLYPYNKFFGKCKNGHEGLWDVRAIVRNGGTCPYCDNRKVELGVNDLKTLRPDLITKWSDKNERQMEEFFTDSSYLAGWHCDECGGDFTRTIREMCEDDSCPYCTNKKLLSGFNDIATLSPKVVSHMPEVLRESARNTLYKPESFILVECSDCHGQYYDSISNIENDVNNCPYCAGKKILPGYNDIATRNPELVKRLAKVHRDNASYIIYKPDSYFLFECPDCHGEYSDTIRNIENGVNNCPYCAGKKALKGFNDLGTVRPDLKEKWSDKNDRLFEDFTPSNTYLGTWHCEECGGDFERNINDMCLDDSCPYCAGKKVLPGYNDVLTLYPALADEMYDIGNYMIGTKLNECTENSSKWSYHKCPDCGEIYRMRIRDRTEKAERGHRACPNCNYIAKNRVFIF